MDSEYVSYFDRMLLPIRKHKFIRPRLDFKLSPRKFMKWLKLVSEYGNEIEELTGDYQYDCTSMCEYSCLYASMLLHGKSLKGELKIRYGNYRNLEHYWLVYTTQGEEYFVDLTLKQFVPEAPQLSITKASEATGFDAYNFLEGSDESIDSYVERQEAFDFFHNPKNWNPPKKKISDLMDPFDNTLTKKFYDSIKDLVY